MRQIKNTFNNKRIEKILRNVYREQEAINLSIVATQGFYIHHTVDEICLGSTLMMMFLLLLTWLVFQVCLIMGGRGKWEV